MSCQQHARSFRAPAQTRECRKSEFVLQPMRVQVAGGLCVICFACKQQLQSLWHAHTHHIAAAIIVHLEQRYLIHDEQQANRWHKVQTHTLERAAAQGPPRYLTHANACADRLRTARHQDPHAACHHTVERHPPPSPGGRTETSVKHIHSALGRLNALPDCNHQPTCSTSQPTRPSW